MTRLSDHYRVRSRYMRSVNLERDCESPGSLAGYIPTPRAIQVVSRVLDAYRGSDPGTAWTLTGVYGTGKSACANFLSALVAPEGSDLRKEAIRLLRQDTEAGKLAKTVRRALPDDGLVRVIAVGRREPVAHTLIRGLARAVEQFWSTRRGRKPSAVQYALNLNDQLSQTGTVTATDLPELFAEVSAASGTGVLLIVDELGKLLEHAAGSAGAEDLYLLQQLAELPHGPDQPPVFILGLLHQAFSEYGHLLAASERAEWEKVQGRFHDIPFAESTDQMLRLTGEAIDSSAPHSIQSAVLRLSSSWHTHFQKNLSEPYVADVLTPPRIASVYPIHPLAALVLPLLCSRFGQNDRSLFSFLAGTSPNALSGFMEQRSVESDGLPLLRLTEVYDYFFELGPRGGVGHARSSRWSEIYSIVHEARGLDSDQLEVLKVIAVLNLVASAGPLRASDELVVSALMTDPSVSRERRRWQASLKKLREQRALTYRERVDEYRLWQGSDFDIDAKLSERVGSDRRSLAAVLSSLAPLSPVVAQRHSYKTGNLRYFERQYADAGGSWESLASELDGSDGVAVYWIGAKAPSRVPSQSADGKPLALIHIAPSPALTESARELRALIDLAAEEVALQTDGVARREVLQRIEISRQVLETALDDALEGATGRWLGGQRDRSRKRLNTVLSDFCDRAYSKGPVLWNELINRRDLTSQGARAQRELIAALLTEADRERLGIEGNGPELSMYDSLLRSTGIHRQEEAGWVIGAPLEKGIESIWNAIEAFCLEATDMPRSVDDLYQVLESPPYGAKRGIIPVLLAAVLVQHADDVSVYQDGSFLPILASPHFELLVKDPGRFSVKHFALAGLRREIFEELESVLRSGGAKRPRKARNATLLTVVRPLVRFAGELPAVTRNAKDLSKEASGVRDALIDTREPDRLIFDSIPGALGMDPLAADEPMNKERRDRFRKGLFEALRELQQYYEGVLDQCAGLIRTATKVESPNLREDLRVRASYLSGKVIEPRLKSFVNAASDGEASDLEWIESLAMVIADRPAANWTREDIVAFEMKAADVGRRFLSLYALQSDSLQQAREGFEARRVTLTRPTGEFFEEIVWVNEEEREAIGRRAEQLLDSARGQAGSDHQLEAIVITMLQKLLEPSEEEGSTKERHENRSKAAGRRHA